MSCQDNAKALILLGFLWKTMHTYTHLRILRGHMGISAGANTQTSVGGRVPLGGVCVVYMYKYTDMKNHLLTTLVTDRNKRY